MIFADFIYFNTIDKTAQSFRKFISIKIHVIFYEYWILYSSLNWKFVFGLTERNSNFAWVHRVKPFHQIFDNFLHIKSVYHTRIGFTHLKCLLFISFIWWSKSLWWVLGLVSLGWDIFKKGHINFITCLNTSTVRLYWNCKAYAYVSIQRSVLHPGELLEKTTCEFIFPL